MKKPGVKNGSGFFVLLRTLIQVCLLIAYDPVRGSLLAVRVGSL